MKDFKKARRLVWIPLALLIALSVFFLLHLDDLTVEHLLAYTPDNYVLAALFLLGMFALKSLSVFFPIVVLYLASAVIFPLPVALLINLAGATVDFLPPYGIGRLWGVEPVESLLSRYPKAKEIARFQRKSDWFTSYFFRIIGCLPGDLVSLYLGALRIPLFRYLTGSLTGILPGLLSSTLIGISISDPTSPLFWGSAAVTIGISALSALLHWKWRQKQQKRSP